MTRLIDADAVIEVQMYDEEKEDFYTEKMTVEDFICRYSEMPSIIDAEPVRHGKWIYIFKKVPVFNYQCSECGARSILFDNFCSYCGARMDKE